MNIQKLQLFAQRSDLKRTLEEELDNVKAELAELEQALLAQFEEDGVPAMKLNRPDGSVTTVYLHRQTWAGPIDGDYRRACEALREAGMGALVQIRFNTQQVSAVIREMTKGGEALPEVLADNLKITERFSLRTRK